MLATLRKWLIILVALYPFGVLISGSAIELVYFVTKPRNLVAKIQPGMVPADVESIVGRPPEHEFAYGCTPDCGPFSYTWTINGHHVEVYFEQGGRVGNVFTYPHREPGLMERFIAIVFFWWRPDFD